jgi:iron(III) transport system permease protein
MISPLRLEAPGHWRSIGLAACFTLAIAPAMPLLWAAIGSGEFSLGQAYGNAMLSSLRVALLVLGVSVAVGLPAGVLSALCEFRGRSVLLALAILPALVPSFLWAIGWSALAARLGPLAMSVASGYTGSVIVFCASAIPIVLLTVFAATRTLTASQLDAARLADGNRGMLSYACRHALSPALLAAALVSVLTLSDPGPAQILGLRSAASEILTSFSALYDFPLAGRQCAALAFVVLMLIAPLVAFAAPRLSSELLVKQVRRTEPLRGGSIMVLAVGLLMAITLIGFALPLAGLISPLGRNIEAGRAWQAIQRTGVNTLVYAVGAALIASTVGLLSAFFAGRSRRLRAVCLGVSLGLFAMPPALIALGLVQLGTAAPEWADPMLRSRLTVCVALGLRLFPVAAVLGLRAWASMPVSWASAASVSGVPLGVYLRRVVSPFFLPTLMVAMLLASLLAAADVGTVLLLHPPGEASLPLAIFSVMANAPESLVASLCLAYVLVAGTLLAALLSFAGRSQR